MLLLEWGVYVPPVVRVILIEAEPVTLLVKDHAGLILIAILQTDVEIANNLLVFSDVELADLHSMREGPSHNFNRLQYDPVTTWSGGTVDYL